MGSSQMLRWQGSGPLARQPGFAITDPEAAQQAASAVIGPHRIGLPAGPEGFCCQLRAMRWPRLSLTYHGYRAPVAVAPDTGDTLYAVNLAVAGYADVLRPRSQLRATPATAAVFSGENTWKMRWSADHEVLCLVVDPPSLEQHLSRLIGEQVDGPVEFAPAMDLRGAGAAWAGVLQLLLDLADAGGAPSALLTAEVENAVMTALLTVQPHAYSAALLEQRAAPGRVVAAAVEVMRSQDGAGLTVTQVAAQAGVSERSLQLAFRRELGCTPSAYLRDVRLDQVHRELLAAGPGGRSVARVAADWGFAHAGRFASAYRQRFGENPSATARRAP